MSSAPQPAAKTGDVVPMVRPSELTFGSLPATDTSSTTVRSGQPHFWNQGISKPTDIPRTMATSNNVPHNADSHKNKLFTQAYVPQPQPQRESQPANGSHYPNNYNNNRNHGPRPHYNYQGKHGSPMGHSPNLQSPQSGYMPHHQKKPISPHMAPTSSPSMPSANIAWTNQVPSQYYVTQGYETRPPFYPPQYAPVAMSPYSGMNIPSPGTRSSPNQPYGSLPQRSSKAIPIINPETMTQVKTEDLKSSSSSSTVNSGKDSVKHEEKKERDFVRTSPSVSRAVPIVDPAIKEREERERREKEEAERKEKEEAERKAREEEERKIREETERKEREERERLEAEKKAREEKERQEREEKERLEAEKRAQEERERKEREERERREREEKERAEAEERERLERERKEKEEAAAREAEERKRELEEQSKNETEQRAAVAATSRQTETTDALSQPTSAYPSRTSTRMRTIDDPSTVQYPPNITPPSAKNPETGKIQYDPTFLMQFQPLCLETTEDLSAFQNIGADENDRMRSTMQRRQTSERGRGPRTPVSPMDMGAFKSRDGRPEMGRFGGGRTLITSRNGSSHGLPPMGTPGSPGGMQREGSHGGRTRSNRGGKGRHTPREQQGGPTIPLEQVAPLEKSENRWVPMALAAQPVISNKEDLIPQDIVVRKVKALLNKLTLEKFDSISDQIFEYAKQSEKEDDGQTLRSVMHLIFEKACDEPAFAGMWAQLCRKMYGQMTDDIKDVTTKDARGNPVSGIPLFRKYLFNRCQEEFERGWKSNLPKLDESNPDVMLSDEYYAAAKAKRQGLGLVQFIGELFKREMLTDRIMYECMKRLCESGAQVEDEEAESLCKLLTTIGQVMDRNPKTSSWIDAFFRRMREEMLKSPNLSSRVKFMIQDVFDLRKNQWAPRRGNQVGPTTIAQIHQEAQKAKNEEKESMKRTASSRGQHLSSPMARSGSHRGGRELQRDSSSGGTPKTTADGWSTVGTASAGSAVKGRTNEMSHFGKTDRSRTRTNILGPSNSPFLSLSRAAGIKASSDKSGAANDGRSSPAPTMSNMFSALGGEGHEESDRPAEKKKLQLLPRGSTLSKESDNTSAASEKPKMSDEAIDRKAKNILDEYLSIRDKQELYECIKELDHPDYHVVFISKLLTVIEGKPTDVTLVCETIPELYKQELIEKTAFVKAFQGFMEGYEDITIDVPQAPKYIARLLVAADIEPSEVLPQEIDQTTVAQLKSEYEKAKTTV
ncbi:hypothetical protein EC973_000828 [Apophysomyces ossiformis]|uniref:MI domain-containing protein n=1 Tax=Apophysomyces ossiformis TaxID=679940 RepID=A0A8H7ENZ4_9FUNG|nr:hypothetical protein EC973_000828 [Apophysomyces ossiformis]